jgi:Phosphotransferase enzyme family
MNNPVLIKFSLSENDLIGSGGESNVYRLPDDKMLRVYKGGKDRKSLLQSLKVFYEGVQGKFPFEMPLILELGEEGGILYSVNKMILGKAMHTVLPALDSEKKKRVFQNYFDAMEEMRGVSFPERLYGEILGEDLVLAPTWTEFLEKSIRKQAAAHDKYLGKDIDNFSELVERVIEVARSQRPNPEKCFVHGDFFPCNVLVNDELEVAGVIDVSNLSVVGDYMLDVAASFIFLETTPGVSEEDIEIYRSIITAHYGKDTDTAFEFYSLYYSLYFGIDEGVEAEAYPKIYQWTVRTLKNFQAFNL